MKEYEKRQSTDAQEVIREAVKNFETLYDFATHDFDRGNLARQTLLTWCESSIQKLKQLLK